MGRPPKLTPHQKKEAIRRYYVGKATISGMGFALVTMNV
jgi:hypothetical protein